MLAGHAWRMERRMEELAWLAWHSLLPWLEKDSKIRPSDLLPPKDVPEPTLGGRLEQLQAHANDLEYLKKKMGVEK